MTDHAIVLTDANGTIAWWSPGAEALFGHSAAAALGQSRDLIVPDELRTRHWAGFRVDGGAAGAGSGSPRRVARASG